MGHRGEAWVAIQAVLLLLFLLAPQIGVPWPYLAVWRIIGWTLAAGGALLLIWSALNLGHALTPFPRPLPQAHLVTGGAYRIVRHPTYCAVLIGCFGLSLATTSPLRLGLTAVLFLFFDRKANVEEHWLQEQHPEYVSYRTRVRKLIPWIY